MTESLRDGGQQCPDCKSPLRPCICEREDKRRSRYGSTLKVNPKTKLRTRTLEEKFGDDPGKYGPLFEAVRPLPCFALTYLPSSPCGLGYAPASAHHLEERDVGGLVPSCSLHHDMMGERTLEVERLLREAGSPSLQAIGKGYLIRAIKWIEDRGEELPAELLGEARKRGLIT